MALPFADAFLPGRAILTRLSAGHRGTCKKRYRLPKGQVKKKWRRRCSKLCSVCLRSMATVRAPTATPPAHGAQRHSPDRWAGDPLASRRARVAVLGYTARCFRTNARIIVAGFRRCRSLNEARSRVGLGTAGVEAGCQALEQAQRIVAVPALHDLAVGVAVDLDSWYTNGLPVGVTPWNGSRCLPPPCSGPRPCRPPRSCPRW
jgi:hypothetical protein